MRLLVFSWSWLALVACGGRELRECTADDQCVLPNGGQGRCVERYCAYNDPSCRTGMRWDQYADRDEQCVPRPDAAPADAAPPDTPPDTLMVFP